jgi:hypothetical protein
MMPRCARALLLVALGGPLAACAPAETPTADPEAAQLDPPVVIVEEPEPEPQAEPEPMQAATEVSPEVLAKDPNTEVINLAGEDSDPGMAEEVTSAPKRPELPSMISDVLTGPNK